MHKPTIPSVKVLMSAFPYHIDSRESLLAAERMMTEKAIRHLIVVREDGGYSLLSKRDLRQHALYGSQRAEELVVGDVCSEQAICADINDPIDRVLDVMAEHHLGSVVVLREGELAGIFTTTDACHHFAEFLRQQAGSDDIPDLIA